MTSPANSPGKSRFLFIDALRGVAALAVLFFHLSVMSALTPALERLWGLAQAVLTLGKYGVQIFFVLSGFVIAHSMRDKPITRVTMLNFIVRRQLRLDPPYWTALVLTLILKWIGLRLTSGLEIKAFPAPSEIGAHFFYLQHFAGFEPILIVA